MSRAVSVTNSSDSQSRRAAVDAYIEEVLNKTGKKITRTDIWKHARYKSRTEFERWERNDAKNRNRTGHHRFTRVLSEKPHLSELFSRKAPQGPASPRIAPRQAWCSILHLAGQNSRPRRIKWHPQTKRPKHS